LKKLIYITVLILCFALILGCNDNKYVETKSIITNKEIKDSDQYYFYVSYAIEGMDGLFEATIKVKNKSVYDSY
jgi:hypothetical protein